MNDTDEKIIAYLLMTIAFIAFGMGVIYLVTRDAESFNGCLARGYTPAECRSR